MSAMQYKLVFRGEVSTGQNLDEVKRKVANIFKITVTKCEDMFSGKAFVIKDGLSYEAAENFKKIFEETGAICNIETKSPVHEKPQPVPPSPQEKEAQAVKTPSFDHNSDKSNSKNSRQVDNAVMREIPQRVKELIHEDEIVLYASRPSKNALTIAMIINGIVYGILGLSLYLIGIIVVLPVALLVTYFSWKNKYYIVTDSRTIVSQGIFNVATKIINNKNIQIISINTGVIDRWLKLNSIELSTAGQGGGGTGIMSAFPLLSKGSVTLKQVVVKDVIKHFADIAH